MPVEAARTGLLGLLRTFAARERCDPPLIVVFDHRTGPPPPAEQDSPWLRVVHAPSADEWIVAWLGRAGDAAHGACVVTADRDLAARARGAGATTEAPAPFAERIRGPRRPRAPGRSRVDARGGKPTPPRGDALLRDLREQSAPRDDDERGR
jgi:hypothetical protein